MGNFSVVGLAKAAKKAGKRNIIQQAVDHAKFP